VNFSRSRLRVRAVEVLTIVVERLQISEQIAGP